MIEVIDQLVHDCADLAATYNNGRRQLIFGPWTALIETRKAQGAFQVRQGPEWTTVLIVEVLAAGAWKQRSHTDVYDESSGRAACMDLVLTTPLWDIDR